MFFGNSRTKHNFDMQEVENLTGLAAYDFGRDNASAVQSLFMLESFCTTTTDRASSFSKRTRSFLIRDTEGFTRKTSATALRSRLIYQSCFANPVRRCNNASAPSPPPGS